MVILASFWKPEACGQKVLPDMLILIGQNLAKNAKIQKFKWDILGYFQTMCFRYGNSICTCWGWLLVVFYTLSGIIGKLKRFFWAARRRQIVNKVNHVISLEHLKRRTTTAEEAEGLAIGVCHRWTKPAGGATVCSRSCSTKVAALAESAFLICSVFVRWRHHRSADDILL